MADGVAGPGADECCERGVSAKHKDVDVELVAQEILESRRVQDGSVVYLGGWAWATEMPLPAVASSSIWTRPLPSC